MTVGVAKGTLWRLHGRNLSWGFIDQAFSSATNFGLSLWAGRLLGPSGLGVVYIGMSAYFVLIAFQRSLLTDPLVTASATLATDGRRRAASFGLTIAIGGGIVGTAVLAMAGAVVRGSIGHGLLLFAPWLIPLLIQDYWRAVLFRDNRGRAASANDGLWLVVMAVLAPLASGLASDWAVVASWAGGAVAGAALGAVQTRTRPARLGPSLQWWRSVAWPLGRWLATNTLVYSLTTYSAIFVLVALLGPGDVGGLQAVTALFGPLSLLANAFSMPGLPAVSRALAASLAAARRLSMGVGALAALLTCAYVAVLKGISLHGSGLLTVVFGKSFSHFSSIVWPVAAGQVVTAATIGFALLLTAQRRGRAILIYGTVTSVSSLVLASILADTQGLTGAAWGLATGLGLGAVGKTLFALNGPRRSNGPAALVDSNPYTAPAPPA